MVPKATSAPKVNLLDHVTSASKLRDLSQDDLAEVRKALRLTELPVEDGTQRLSINRALDLTF